MLVSAEAKLVIELVPATSWGANLRAGFSRAQWKSISDRVAYAAGHRCELCGGRGPRHAVECHEVWHYDDTKHTQTLVRLEALCPACHQVKHIGRMQAIGKLHQALCHLAKVNDWCMDDAREYFYAALDQWAERSRHKWTVHVSALKDFFE